MTSLPTTTTVERSVVRPRHLDVSILIVSYNTREMTLACLKSVFEQTSGIDFEVIVVDNASTDGSAEAIAQAFPQVRLIAGGGNLGFAGGNNRAAQEARKLSESDFLLLLNPDTHVLEGAIQRLHEFAQQHPEAAIFGGRTCFENRQLNPASCWGKPTVRSVWFAGLGLTALFPNSTFLNPEGYGGWKRDTVRQVDFVSGCFLLIRRKLWEGLGGFDPAFFMYGEEADLCWRAAKAGHRCMICPEARIVHYGGASETVRADKMVKLFIAKARLFGKHWKRGAVPFGVWALHGWALIRVVAFGVLSLVQAEKKEQFATWRSVWRRRGEWTAAAKAAA